MIDSKKIDELAQVLRSNGLTRLRLEEDGNVVELECAPAPQEVVVAPTAAGVAPAAAMPAAPAPAPAASVEPEPQEEVLLGPDDKPLDMSKVVEVTAPMVGVFYAAPSPGAEPFVHVGSKVHRGDTLCVIEAMKLMNEVVAEQDGEVVDVCVKDGELVEYGCTLMKLY
ncbi:MAG: acetyl-CoA carboxylase biotin carboxyl carrier protein [Atopobiaceae bacterium]